MAPEREVSSDPILHRDESQLIEAADLALSPSLVFDVRPRSTAPESERGAKRPRRIGGLFGTRTNEQALELGNVGIGDPQPIAGPVSLDRLRRQRAAQLGDIALYDLGRARRRLLAPEVL